MSPLDPIAAAAAFVGRHIHETRCLSPTGLTGVRIPVTEAKPGAIAPIPPPLPGSMGGEQGDRVHRGVVFEHESTLRLGTAAESSTQLRRIIAMVEQS